MQDNEKKPALRFKGFTDPWEQRKLTNLCEKFTDGDWIEAKDQSDSGVRLVQTGNVGVTEYLDKPNNKKWISFETFEQLHCEEVYPGDILISRLPEPAGRACIMPNLGTKMITAVDCTIVRPNAVTSTRFLLQYLSSQAYFDAVNTCLAGGTRQRISRGNLAQFNVPIPSSKIEQEKIGEILEKLDTLITLHQRKYEKLVNIKKSMLDKMFPKNGASVPEIRFKGFTDPWEQRKLSELTSMHARIGWQNLRTSEFLDSGDYMLITGTDFDDGTVNYSTCHFVERERYEQDKNIQIRNGSILITKDGTLGKVAYVQSLSMPATLNAGVFNVEIRNTSIVDERYLFQYLKAPFLMDYVDKKATGGTIKHLNQNILVDFPVVMPKKTEQVSIGNFFQRIDTLITLHQRKLEKLQNIKKSCLEKMFV
ncbi:restriction endonuclease subunit S [Faecalibacterium prausnitzii]|nr:restriction endonuclease subunit S [Faecalibacterium prausnitzii]